MAIECAGVIKESRQLLPVILIEPMFHGALRCLMLAGSLFDAPVDFRAYHDILAEFLRLLGHDLIIRVIHTNAKQFAY